MNAFDHYIFTFLNRFAAKSWAVDYLFHSLAGNNLLKGGLLVAILWALWFTQDGANEEKTRKLILVTFVGTFMGLFLTRVLVHILPFRPRPIHNMEIVFRLPHAVVRETLDNLSAFPSDHAALFFGFATGIYLISRYLGYLVIGYCFLISFIVRVYMGYHYPTDVIAGASIGIFFVLVANTPFVRKYVVDKIFNLSLAYPRMFYGLFFLYSYQAADLFQDSRNLAAKGVKLLKILAN